MLYFRNELNEKILAPTLAIVPMPMRAMNHFGVAIKADVVSSDTGSRCTAFTLNDTDMHT